MGQLVSQVFITVCDTGYRYLGEMPDNSYFLNLTQVQRIWLCQLIAMSYFIRKIRLVVFMTEIPE